MLIRSIIPGAFRSTKETERLEIYSIFKISRSSKSLKKDKKLFAVKEKELFTLNSLEDDNELKLDIFLMLKIIVEKIKFQ